MAPARLATSIGRVALPNPVICGAGEHLMTPHAIRAALRTGAAIVVGKSFNESSLARRQLDRAAYGWLDADHEVVPDGTVGRSLFCRSGLIDRDADSWIGALADLDREAAQSDQRVAASIVLADPTAAAVYARQCADAGLRTLELNVGAPHASQVRSGAIVSISEPDILRAIVRRVRDSFSHLFWVKLSGLADNLPELAEAVREGGADAACMAGRHLGFVPDLDTLAPELGTMAAYGGAWALPITCRHLALSRERLGPEFDLVGTNGVRSGLDTARMILSGASAIQATTMIWHGGFQAVTDTIDQLDRWLESKGLTVATARGRAADAIGRYADQPLSPGAWKTAVIDEVAQ